MRSGKRGRYKTFSLNHLALFPAIFIVLFPPASFSSSIFFLFFWRHLFIASYSLRHALFFITSVSLVPFSFRQPPTSKWHKISWIICLFFCCCFFVCVCIAWKRALPRKCARFVLFRPIKKRSFNLSCVLDLFRFLRLCSSNQSQLVMNSYFLRLVWEKTMQILCTR